MNVHALCEVDGVVKSSDVAYSWQKRPMCINEPVCLDGLGSAGHPVDVVFDAIEASQHAKKCGSMPAYECFIKNATHEDGQKYCDK